MVKVNGQPESCKAGLWTSLFLPPGEGGNPFYSNLAATVDAYARQGLYHGANPWFPADFHFLNLHEVHLILVQPKRQCNPRVLLALLSATHLSFSSQVQRCNSSWKSTPAPKEGICSVIVKRQETYRHTQHTYTHTQHTHTGICTHTTHTSNGGKGIHFLSRQHLPLSTSTTQLAGFTWSLELEWRNWGEGLLADPGQSALRQIHEHSTLWSIILLILSHLKLSLHPEKSKWVLAADCNI
jgi:hypothetical protein